MTSAVYAIGDIHGDLNQLRAVHRFIEMDIAEFKVSDHSIVHVGDLVDRRQDSKGVVEFLLHGIKNGQPWVVVKGNHDRLFTDFLEDAQKKDPVLRSDYTWLHPSMGGRETLASYGVHYGGDKPMSVLHHEAVAAVPPEHFRFLKHLPLSFETSSHFFCHAGILPDRPLAEQTEDDLLWIRAPFHNWTEPHEKLIIHGHTPVDKVTHYGNRINIDTGAAWGYSLSAIVLAGNSAWEVTASGRKRVNEDRNRFF
ncbi:MAG: serine/threonine protein phosphatase [Rhodobacteraceae bacterium]|nr:serine/threonine protein phosphatase [Paracoccaceae bacterium]